MRGRRDLPGCYSLWVVPLGCPLMASCATCVAAGTTHGATRLSAAKAVIARHLPSHSYTRKNESRNGCSQLFCSSVTGNNNGGGERVRCTHCRGSFFFNVQARGVVYADVRNTFYGADAEKAEAAANAHLAHLLQPFGGSVEKEKQHWEQHP